MKFHWRPLLGAVSCIWDEAVKINGADPDFHRRDLFEAIARGDFPEWEFCIQAFDQKTADSFDFDILDATKLIPEEIVPLEVIGRMVLNRNPDNHFAETEQAAFHPGHVPPGIDFTNDPLLQGRLFSYTDTQLLRLGGPNFHELEINRPRCPMQNFQRDGIKRQHVPTGRVAYEPNSLDPAGPRESAQTGYRTFAAQNSEDEQGDKLRQRSESFADHYSQARLFFRSMAEPEQRHIVSAFAFELGKVETVAIRKRMLGHLMIIDEALGAGVEAALGMEGEADTITPARDPIDMDPSPTLSLIKKAKPTLEGRKVAALVTDGVDDGVLDALRKAVEKEGALLAIVAPKIGGVTTARGKAAAGRSGALRRALGHVRRGCAAAVRGRCSAARQGGGRGRLAARRVRSPEGDRPCRGRRAAVREGGGRAGCRCRRGVAGKERAEVHRRRQTAPHLGA